MKNTLAKALCSILIIFCLVIDTSLAEVVTDGTVGASSNLAGPAFVIDETLGTRSGNNLFHSFQSFNINGGESALFTGNASIQNVINRVTGGGTSLINGSLSSTVGSANFYFINPAGVVFGASAWVDVPASFHVSTADSLVFADGTAFSASNPGSSSLSVAEPASFGFTGGGNGDISVNNSLLWLKPGNTLSLVGGNITMDTALAAVEGGAVRLIANGTGIGNVSLSGSSLDRIGNGTLSITGTEIDGQDSTDIFLSGGKIVLNNSRVYHTTSNEDRPGSIVLQGNDLIMENSSTISSINYSEFSGASTEIKMNNTIDLSESSMISSATAAAGNGGDILVSAVVKLNILGDSRVIADTLAEGNAGSVRVDTRDLNIDGQGTKGGIVSEAKAESAGRAGDVHITAANAVKLSDGGVISSNTFSEGNAGSVYIETGRMTVNGGNVSGATGVSSEAGSGSLGNAGEVKVKVRGTLNLLHGGIISSSTWGEGNGGYVSISAGEMLVDGQGKVTGVTSQSNSGSTGSAGSVSVNVKGDLSILSGGSISSSTQADGNAGSVNIRAENVAIDGTHSTLFTGIESRAERGASGNVGNVTVSTVGSAGSAGGVYLANGGQISIAHYGSSGGGRGQALISIEAGEIKLENNAKITSESTGNVPAADIRVSSSDILDIRGSSRISTESNNADAGDISVRSDTYLMLKNGLITTSVNGSAGNGGDISVVTPILIMDTGFVQANTQGQGGRGGAISVEVDHLIGSYGTVEIGGGVPRQFLAHSHVNIIQAAAPEGAPGDIEVSVPVTDITGSLLRLNSDFSNLTTVGGNPCKVDPGATPSSLTWVGRGGLPPSAADPLSIPLTDRCD